jgi:hypothetical protein
MPHRTRNPRSSREELEEFVLGVLPTPLDFSFENHGSLCLLRPLTEAAVEWMDEHLPMDNPETQFWGDAIVIEPRYCEPILEGIAAGGLSAAEVEA